MNHSTTEELTQLREEVQMLKKSMNRTLDEIRKRENYYYNLVLLARIDPDSPRGKERIDRIKNELGEEHFNTELAELENDETARWTHGFNSGMLAAANLYSELLDTTPRAFEITRNEDTGNDEVLPRKNFLESRWKLALYEFPVIDRYID
tara:strand:+ start:904 stop:1353 length:450 start_codon:yes stop_codon:yes gene_type:complete